MNRRTVLKATAASLAGATAITGAQALSTLSARTGPALADLVVEWRKLDRMANEAQDVVDNAQEAAWKHYPDVPVDIRRNFMGRYIPVSREDIERQCNSALRNCTADSPFAEQARATRNRRLRALADWKAQRKAIDAARGIPALEARAKAVWTRLDIVEQSILNAPSRSLADLRMKVEVCRRHLPPPDDLDGFDQQLTQSLFNDIDRLVS